MQRCQLLPERLEDGFSGLMSIGNFDASCGTGTRSDVDQVLERRMLQ
jgi:hypothetical protein